MNRGTHAGLNRRHPDKFPQSVPAVSPRSGMAYDPFQPRQQPEVTIIELPSQEGSLADTTSARPHTQARGGSMVPPNAPVKPKFGQAPDQRRNVPQVMGTLNGQGMPRGMPGRDGRSGGDVPVQMSRADVVRRLQLERQGKQGHSAPVQPKKRPAENEEARSTTPSMPAPGAQRPMRPLPHKVNGQTVQQRNPEIPMPPAASLPMFQVPGDIAKAHSILHKVDLIKVWNDVGRRQTAAVEDEPEWDKASAAHDAFGETMEKAMFFFNTLIGRYNELAFRKNDALADKQDLTRSYENAGAQLSKQCTNLDASTQQIKMPNPKRMRIKNIAENRD